MNQPQPIRSDRVRTIEKPFAWIPCRILMNGLFGVLSDEAKLLYLFLCLAADRQGLSFYGDHRIQSYFQIQPAAIAAAIHELIQKDLIAYDGHLYQVLSLPSPTTKAIVQPQRNSEPERLQDILARLVATR
jgi:hypothetical protein